jgi:hypothetical protein
MAKELNLSDSLSSMLRIVHGTEFVHTVQGHFSLKGRLIRKTAKAGTAKLV